VIKIRRQQAKKRVDIKQLTK